MIVQLSRGHRGLPFVLIPTPYSALLEYSSPFFRPLDITFLSFSHEASEATKCMKSTVRAAKHHCVEARDAHPHELGLAAGFRV